MFFELNEKQKTFQKRVQRIFEREVSPLVEEYERKKTFPVSLSPTLGAERLLCLRCPEKYGGPGLDKVSECITMEELNRICAGIGAGIMVHGGLATDPLLRYGSEDLKQRYLPPAARGEKIGAFALTEPDAGSDASGIRTTALKQGNGYRLNGSKTFITNGTICDFVTVAAYTDPTKRGTGINLFIVNKDDLGFSVAKKLEKLGNHSSDTAELVFDDCFVPKERMLGEQEGGGLAHLEGTLKSGRITYGARSTGGGAATFDATLPYIKRTQRIVQKAMAIQKNIGLMMDNPIQRFLRDARLFKIPEGTSEIQHLVISRELGV